MSETQQITPQAAYQEITDKVHAPVFFDKLASAYGIRPNSEQEALDLLAMGGQLQQAYDANGGEKQADVESSRFGGFVRELNPGQQAADDANLIKSAAANLAKDPNIANCVLTLQADAATRLSQAS